MNKLELIEKLKTSNEKESVLLRGRLISYIKNQIRHTSNRKDRLKLRVELYEELYKHKEVLNNLKQCNKKYKLSEKVGLKIRGISNSINIFKEKYDVISKLKRSILGIATSGLVVGSLSALSTVLTGGSLSVVTLTSILPTISYIGLSNIIKTPFTDTMWTRFTKNYGNRDKNAKDFINFIDSNIVDNKLFLDLLNKKVNTKDNYELSNINEELVNEFKNIIGNANNDEIRRILTFEKINTMMDLKKNYSKIKRDYLKDRNEMTKKEYSILNKKSLNLDIELFKENNFLKDVSEQTLKNLGITTGSMYLSRMILSPVFSSLKMDSMIDVISPFVFSLINNVGNADSIREKIRIKQSVYNDQKIKLSNPELLKRLSETKTLAIN
ncbi:MAG: hypothetical protein PHX40_04195 [Bacilli bacterium]|nr:hypothetical protein [Bacilli bacterium]